jgi:hypothetical protein
MKNRFLRLLPLILSIIFLSGCAKTYKEEFLGKAKAEGWNEAQQYAAYHYSLRAYLMEKDAAGEYQILFQRMSKELVEQRFGKFLDDFNGILDPKNQENARFIEFFNMRKELEHKERVYKAVYDRLRVARLADKFEELNGTSSYYGADAWRVKGYNIKQIFGNDFADSFKNQMIETARREGRLEQIEHIIWFADQQLAEKQSNPNNPTDPNDFIWLPRRRGVELTNYKILTKGEKPFDNNGNYIEGVRLELAVNGNNLSIKKESKPALRIFMERDGKGIMIMDKDVEGKDVGFGLPDLVETIQVASADNLIRASSNILERLFEEKQSHKRVYPKYPPIQLQIAQVSDQSFWEVAADAAGWKVPLEYRSKQEDNYNVKLKVEREKLADGSVGKYMTIKYLVKEWTSGNNRYQPSRGNVVEYYKMRPPFDTKVVHAQVLMNDDTKKISIVLQNGKEEKGTIAPGANNVFIADKPYTIIYTAGQKRYTLVDEDGDGKYEKRKEIAVPKNYKTGDYSEDAEEKPNEPAAMNNGDGDDDNHLPKAAPKIAEKK